MREITAGVGKEADMLRCMATFRPWHASEDSSSNRDAHRDAHRDPHRDATVMQS